MDNDKTGDKIGKIAAGAALFGIGMAISAPVTLTIGGLALVGKFLGDKKKSKDRQDLEDIKRALQRMQR